MKGKLQNILIVILVFFNFILLFRHIKLLNEIKSLNINEDSSIVGRKLPERVLNFIGNDSSKYFLVLILKDEDCSACLNYIVPLLKTSGDSLGVKVFGLYAGTDTLKMHRAIWLYKFDFKVFQEPEIVKFLSLKKTPCVLFVTNGGSIVYAYYPNYLNLNKDRNFFLKISSLLK
jgi:hypothetical protein